MKSSSLRWGLGLLLLGLLVGAATAPAGAASTAAAAPVVHVGGLQPLLYAGGIYGLTAAISFGVAFLVKALGAVLRRLLTSAK